MNIVTIFNPAVTTNGNQFTVPQSAANGKIVVWNESNISLTLSFQDGASAYVPAWSAVMFCHETGNVNVTWAQQATLSSLAPPLSQVVVETYAAGEHLPGTFPMALTRQSNVGNVISTVGGTASAIQNDGNPAATSILEATVAGDGASAVTLSNNANFKLGDVTNIGSFLLASGKIGMTTVGDMIDAASSATEMHVNATGGDIVFKTVVASVLTEVGRMINNGSMSLPGNATAVVNGSTSGTAQGWMILNSANFKLFMVYQNNFRNGLAGQQFLSVPIPFFAKQVGVIVVGGSNAFQLIKSSVAQTVNILTTLASAGGSSTGVTNAGGWSIGQVNSGIDTVGFNGAEASAHNGLMLLFGQ